MSNHKVSKEKNKLFQTTISYLLLASIIFLGLPVGVDAQAKENPKITGKAISLIKETSSKYNKMSANSFTELKQLTKRNGESIAKTKSAKGGEKTYVVLNVEFMTPESRRAIFTEQKSSKLKGAYVLTVIDRFADIFIDEEAAWDALLNNKNVLKVEYATEVDAPPPPEVLKTKLTSLAVAESIVRGGYDGLTGKNVIIAIVDTGVDFRHPDFINYDSNGRPTSRIAYLWDTATEYKKGRGNEAPFKFPNGSSIGTLYTKEQLTNELRSDKVTIPATDIDGHGTACASVAAGNGNADKGSKEDGKLNRRDVVGVAPDADIIGVRLGYDDLVNAYLLNAIAEWLENTAGKTPLVISGSFGGHGTGHDGQTVRERQLDARFPLDDVGRAVVFAAGNEGTDAIHAKVNFAKEPKLVSWNANRPAYIKIYLDSADENLGIFQTDYTPLTRETMYRSINPITNQLEITIKVDQGVGAIGLNNSSGKAGEAHLYFADERLGVFSPENVAFSHLVGSPGSMENAITVGSYDWNDNFYVGGNIINLSSVCSNGEGGRMSLEIGWLSCYSSPGPSRRMDSNGRSLIKPDIVAPGEWFASSYAKLPGIGGAKGWNVDQTGMYAAMNGTSAATPYTSGIVALMFEKKPSLTLGEVKRLLKKNSTKSSLNAPSGSSDGIPNNNWGYGKLDMAAVEKIFADLE